MYPSTVCVNSNCNETIALLFQSIPELARGIIVLSTRMEIELLLSVRSHNTAIMPLISPRVYLSSDKHQSVGLGGEFLKTFNSSDVLWAINEARDDHELVSFFLRSPYSVAIVRNSDSKMLAANMAVSRTHGKKVSDGIGESLAPLWMPEELERAVMRPLLEAQRIIDTEYSCYKWEQREGDWVRSRQDLVGSFFSVSYMGEDCRMSINVRSR